jgi:hypothetical protein
VGKDGLGAALSDSSLVSVEADLFFWAKAGCAQAKRQIKQPKKNCLIITTVFVWFMGLTKAFYQAGIR